ncbi:MAG: acetyltransferase, ribosomal protein N-acetylase [Osedax symbiont Rs1]|nr:MAG: acetyltransferase, ribosomal protein N-acetylase [Osedax symbiont Rs1]
MSITIIETPRLNLGLLIPEEFPLLQQYLLINKEHLARWEPSREPVYFTEYEVTLRIKSALLAFKQQSAFHWVILNKSDDQVLGVCNFSNLVRGPMQACHLGYAVSAAHQGTGIMHEALTAAILYIFEKLQFHRIMANYMPDNQRSAKLLESLGFEREGYAKAYLKIAGQWQDHVLTALVNPNDSTGD